MVLRIEIIDNADGTWTANSINDAYIVPSLINPGEVTIHEANVVYLDDISYRITSTPEPSRPMLQELLVNLLGSDNVYFQPPPSKKLLYPCIIYNRDDIDISYADNSPYRHKKRYQVTVIDRDPDSDIPDKVSMLPLCSFDRHFTADNLNHDVFNLYF